MSARRGRGMLVPLDDVTIGLIYGRVSSKEQAEEGISLDDQLDTNRQYCAAKRIVIGGEFQDVQSGRRENRRDYQAMKTEVRALKAEGRRPAVIVKYQDRLGRNMLEAAKAYVELTELGVNVHIADSGGVPSELEYYMRALLAQEESRGISRKITSAHRYFREKLWHRPGLVPWGYRLRKATGDEDAAGAPSQVLELDPVTAPYVREAFERAADGESVRSIALWVAGLPSVARGGRTLGYATLRKRLRAPVYVARLGEYDEDDPDTVLDRPVAREPRIIDDDVWRRVTVQQRLAAKLPPQARGEFMLTGLLRCPRCGSRMSGRTRTRTTRREYLCQTAMVLGAENDGPSCWFTVPADQIEQELLWVLTGTLKAAGLPSERRRVIRELRRQVEPPAGGDVAARIAELEAERRKTQERMDALTDMRADREIDAEQYKRRSAGYLGELDRIAGALAELRRDAPKAAALLPLDVLLGSCSAWGRALTDANVGPLRATLAVLLERVSPVRLGRGSYELDYTWTTTGWGLIVAAIEALSADRSADGRAMREHLIRVDALARAKDPTKTIAALLDREQGAASA